MITGNYFRIFKPFFTPKNVSSAEPTFLFFWTMMTVVAARSASRSDSSAAGWRWLCAKLNWRIALPGGSRARHRCRRHEGSGFRATERRAASPSHHFHPPPLWMCRNSPVAGKLTGNWHWAAREPLRYIHNDKNKNKKWNKQKKKNKTKSVLFV